MIYRRRRPGSKVVLDIRSIPVEVGLLARWWADLWLRQALLPGAVDGVTVLSEGMAAELDAEYPFLGRVPVAIWGSGYDPRLFRPGLDGGVMRAALHLDDQLMLLYHGTLSANRGLHEAVDAVHLLRSMGVPATLVLAGRGPARTALTAQVRQLRLWEAVRLLEPLPYDRIPALVAAADVGLSPLPIHPWWRHQSPIKVYEFLAMGVPVVATDMPCHQGISRGVTLVPDNRPETLATAIRSTAAIRPELAQQALTDAQAHTWGVRARVLAQFLDELVEG
jgi:glycosyltransferase involved in cell wall biosynthesis